jgi:hypothetical protein
MPSNQITVKIFGIKDAVSCGKVFFDPDVPLADAHALLAYCTPVEELLSFRGPKAWYCIESLRHSRFKRNRLWRKAHASLKSDGLFLHYASPNPARRVPHYCTGHDSFSLYYDSSTAKINEAVALVSHFGNRFWRLSKWIRLRNAFATHSKTRLYGSSNWNNFNAWGILGPRGAPKNYAGEPSAKWHSTRDHYRWLSQYKVIICMENRSEPFYFTEKFPAAVMAGGIPIYHAHEQIANTILKGAMWVDPKDFGFDPSRTIDYALQQDVSKYQKTNAAWLLSDRIANATRKAIFDRIATILAQKISSFRDANTGAISTT